MLSKEQNINENEMSALPRILSLKQQLLAGQQQKKWVYFFSKGKSEGNAKLKNLLGGKGANLAEMCKIGVPIPPGFTIITDGCQAFYSNGKKIPQDMIKEVDDNLKQLEDLMGKKLGCTKDPLLVSVRSGAPVSMPGMMDTILNLGLNDQTVIAIANNTKNERFAYDSYRRFIHMFGTTVLGIEHKLFEEKLEHIKTRKGIKHDTELNTADLKDLVAQYKVIYKNSIKKDFPQDTKDQLKMAIEAVFDSWNSDRAIIYRRINDIRNISGTAVNIQTMVFGNMGDTSGTGVAFTRDPSTGKNEMLGEFLMNAQGEDVVAGIRTPLKIHTLKEILPNCYQEFMDICAKLELHFKEMQDVEFTIQEKKLYFLQCRTGKRTAQASLQIAVDMVQEGLIQKQEAILRISPSSLNQLLHKVVSEASKKKAKLLGKGLNASPGAAVGQIVFTPQAVKEWVGLGKKVILVRLETSPEDIEGMNLAEGILTARGGMTSHAAVVARGMGKCCVCGWDGISVIDETKKYFTTKNNETYKEGDYLTIIGTTGEVFEGALPLQPPQLDSGAFKTMMDWADQIRKLRVRTNADIPRDAEQAVKFGAEGIGLCRTEHMFFKKERIGKMREMILASDEKQRKQALLQLEVFQKEDFLGLFKAMAGLPVTIRLLDPPLHEFLPQAIEDLKEIADNLGITMDAVKSKCQDLHEFNPMLGHRGCRLGITFPEISEMQARAIFEAAAEAGSNCLPEIMIPLVGFPTELTHQKKIVEQQHFLACQKYNKNIPYLFGTMIEEPRACVVADKIAQHASFFSFGTNDLTQMTCGFSRDDSAKFLKYYVDNNILEKDPFISIDRDGVGVLMKMACEKAKKQNPKFKLGICGEQGGDPESIEFCHLVGLDYVSCSPFRVPIAKLAAAQAQIKFPRQN